MMALVLWLSYRFFAFFACNDRKLCGYRPPAFLLLKPVPVYKIVLNKMILFLCINFCLYLRMHLLFIFVQVSLYNIAVSLWYILFERNFTDVVIPCYVAPIP